MKSLSPELEIKKCNRHDGRLRGGGLLANQRFFLDGAAFPWLTRGQPYHEPGARRGDWPNKTPTTVSAIAENSTSSNLAAVAVGKNWGNTVDKVPISLGERTVVRGGCTAKTRGSCRTTA